MSIEVQHIPGSALFAFSDDIADEDNSTYFIHDNGGRPYRVQIKPNKIAIFDNYHGSLLYEIQDYTRVFIGESPLTEITRFGGGHGPAFRGNSILVESSQQEYIFIGKGVFAFTTNSPINYFLSEVGNNDVPYPYAIDELDHFYLFTEHAVLDTVSPDFIDDPYQSLYSISQQRYQDILGIKGFIGKDQNEVFRLSFQLDPENHYERPWMTNLQVVLMDNSKVPITKMEYINMMEKINSELGISHLISLRIS